MEKKTKYILTLFIIGFIGLFMSASLFYLSGFSLAVSTLFLIGIVGISMGINKSFSSKTKYVMISFFIAIIFIILGMLPYFLVV